MASKVKVIHQSTLSAALPRSETSKPADSCWNQLLNAVTSCLLSHDHLLNFSVWLLIRSSQSSGCFDFLGKAALLENVPLRLWWTGFETLAAGCQKKKKKVLETTDRLYPFIKASRAAVVVKKKKAQGLAAAVSQRNHLASHFSSRALDCVSLQLAQLSDRVKS